MLWLELDFVPASAFATPVRGFTLFGHSCALIARQDPGHLETLLRGYTRGQPFVVIGDPRPAGHVPRPTIPMHMFEQDRHVNSKAAKARRWTPVEVVEKPLESWLAESRSDAELAAMHGLDDGWQIAQVHASARIGPRSPIVRRDDELWFSEAVPLVIDVIVDETQCSVAFILGLLRSIGREGYGAGASRGRGKFEIGPPKSPAWTPDSSSPFLLALGHCIPEQVRGKAQLRNSYYRATVHHGRHGPSEKPVRGDADMVKAPVVLAQPGAVFCVAEVSARDVYGRGLGAQSRLSLREPRTVIQGYSPVIGVKFATGDDSLRKSMAAKEAA